MRGESSAYLSRGFAQAAWSGAYESLLGGDCASAAELFEDGLRYFEELYSNDEYWEELRERGHLLSSGSHPFDEIAFMEWRQQALWRLIKPLVDDLVLPLLNRAGSDLDSLGGEILCTRRILEAIDNACVPGVGRTRLSREIWEGLLRKREPDSSRPEEFVSMAERVVGVDPGNAFARHFLIKLVTEHVAQGMAESGSGSRELWDWVERARPHAEWLAEERGRVASDGESDMARRESDLAEFWYVAGAFKHARAMSRVDAFNQLSGSRRAKSGLVPSLLTELRDILNESDRLLRTSAEFRPLDSVCMEMIAHHERLRRSIRDMLENAPS